MMRVVIGVFVLMAVLAGPVFAQDSPIPAFDVWLVRLSGPLAAVAVALILSWVVEFWPAYDKLAPRVKRLSFAALCLIVPVLAATLRGALGYVPWSFDPLYWHALWYGAAAYGMGNLAHTRKLKKSAE